MVYEESDPLADKYYDLGPYTLRRATRPVAPWEDSQLGAMLTFAFLRVSTPYLLSTIPCGTRDAPR